MIIDVQKIDLNVNEDERGFLFEVFKSDQPYFKKFGQVYVVQNPKSGTIRAFHKHDELWDYFCIVNGRAKFILVDDREDSPTYKEVNEFISSARKPVLLIVPPGVYHGWESLSDNTILLSTASEVYNKENPDEYRISWDTYGKEIWEVKFK